MSNGTTDGQKRLACLLYKSFTAIDVVTFSYTISRVSRKFSAFTSWTSLQDVCKRYEKAVPIEADLLALSVEVIDELLRVTHCEYLFPP